MAITTSATAALAVPALLPPHLHSPPSSASHTTADTRRRGGGGAAIPIQTPHFHVQIQAFSPPPTPKGFGVPPTKRQQQPRPFTRPPLDSQQTKDLAERAAAAAEDDDDVVPEVISNRMLKRIGFTVGIPLLVGVVSFPLFYYVKVAGNLDVPTWIPLATSLILFGTAGVGVAYGILSTSWDPLREGSLLGWEEAKINWPVFWKQASQNQDN